MPTSSARMTATMTGVFLPGKRRVERRPGYLVGCTAPRRAASGRQEDGGHTEYLLAEESTCVALPDSLSYLDGACVAYGGLPTTSSVTRCRRVMQG